MNIIETNMRIFLCSLVIFLTPVMGSAQTNSKLLEVKDFGLNRGNLRMFIYVPPALATSLSPVPLIVALHGCSQNAKTIGRQSGWNELADKYNFIVVYPQQKRINNPSGCFNWFRSKDIEADKGECSSIKDMVEFTIDSRNIDTSRIYAYGLSAGAAMSVNLLASYPCSFSAGAILAGAPYKVALTSIEGLKAMTSPPDKSPEEWGALLNEQRDGCLPRLVVIHGTKDGIVKIKSSHELIEQWTFMHNTDSLATYVVDSFASNPLVERSSYLDSSRKEVIVFYKISKIGHKLPVDPVTLEHQGGATGIFAIDRDFFSTYYIAKDFGLIE